MKTLEIQLPDRLAARMESLVEAGWFLDQEELTRQALSHFVRHHHFELEEEFQREDIRWALGLKGAEA